MKKLLAILVILFSTHTTLQAQGYDTLVLYEKQQIVYLASDSINIRQSPSIEASTVAKLPIGTKLKIIDKSKVASRLNNILTPWYLVEFNGKQRGYVWGGKLAWGSFRSNKNPDIVFHLGVEKEEDGVATFQIRVEQANKELQRMSFKGFGSVYKRHTFTNISNKGLSNVDDILQVDGYAESCGEGAGAIVFFWCNNKLSFVDRLFDIADGEYFDRQFFVYPSDIEGEKETILKKEEAGERLIEDDQKVGYWGSSNVKYSKNSTTRFVWNGSKLIRK